MAAQDLTFDLVKSLSMNEKRYFRVSAASAGESKNYLLVFDALDKMETYDAKKLALQLKGLNVSYEKNYLRKQILRSLRSFHAESGIEINLLQKLTDIQILYQKKQYKLCLSELERYIPVAEEYEKFALLYELLRWKSTVAYAGLLLSMTRDFLKEDTDKARETLARLVNFQEYEELHDQFFYLTKTKKGFEDKKERIRFEQLMKNDLLRDETKALSKRARNYFHSMNATYYLLKGDFERSFEHSHALLQNAEESPAMIRDEPRVYYSSLHNFLVRCVPLRKHELFAIYLEKLRRLPEMLNGERKKHFEGKILFSVAHIELHYWTFNGYFAEGAAAIDRICAGLRKFDHESSLEHEMVLHTGFGILLLGDGQYKKALQWFSRVMAVTTMRSDLQSIARLLKFIVYVEQQDQHGMEVTLHECRGYFARLQTLRPLETTCLRFFEAYVRARQKPEKILREFGRELEILKQQDATVISQFNFIVWVRSRLEGKRMEELMTEN